MEINNYKSNNTSVKKTRNYSYKTPKQMSCDIVTFSSNKKEDKLSSAEKITLGTIGTLVVGLTLTFCAKKFNWFKKITKKPETIHNSNTKIIEPTNSSVNTLTPNSKINTPIADIHFEDTSENFDDEIKRLGKIDLYPKRDRTIVDVLGKDQMKGLNTVTQKLNDGKSPAECLNIFKHVSKNIIKYFNKPEVTRYYNRLSSSHRGIPKVSDMTKIDKLLEQIKLQKDNGQWQIENYDQTKELISQGIENLNKTPEYIRSTLENSLFNILTELNKKLS